MVTMSRTTAGFSLVEVVCAFAVLGALGLGLVHGGQDHGRSLAAGFARTCALRVAHSELERLRAAPPAALVRGRTEFAVPAGTGLPHAVGAVIVLPDGQVADGVLSICATVEWRDPATAKIERLSLLTLRAVEVGR